MRGVPQDECGEAEWSVPVQKIGRCRAAPGEQWQAARVIQVVAVRHDHGIEFFSNVESGRHEVQFVLVRKTLKHPEVHNTLARLFANDTPSQSPFRRLRGKSI